MVNPYHVISCKEIEMFAQKKNANKIPMENGGLPKEYMSIMILTKLLPQKGSFQREGKAYAKLELHPRQNASNWGNGSFLVTTFKKSKLHL